MRIKVTGYIYIEDDEYDPGELGPLTKAAYEEITMHLSLVEDLKFELAEDE